ncbi:ABC transporter permease [Vibrio marisflavi]|uniref:ABC transporter permease n=1 Tax=Vibrio marisflavi TaxID=1216040 RepID=UPI003F4A01C9
MVDKFTSWKMSSTAIAAALFLPIAAIAYTSLGQTDDIFSHLMSTVMPTYVFNTVVLAIGVMLLAFLFGLPSAWLMARCSFPSDKILQWLLVLPLAMPGYIVAYIFTDWFDFAGPIQSALRDVTGWGPRDYWFPDIRSITGSIIVLALVLYPYVYLLCRASFIEQSSTLTQSARLLKCNAWQTFLRVSLPLARPAIAVSLSLVAMEAIGDYGTVSYFAVNTLTTAVYDTWLGYSSLTAAAKISMIMLFFIVLFIGLEGYSRRKQKLFQSKMVQEDRHLIHLTGGQKWCAIFWCWGLVSIAFIFPIMQLLYYAYQYIEQSWTTQFRDYSINSLKVSLSAAMVAVFVALIVNFRHRLLPGLPSEVTKKAASMGYAVPGTVLAIGVMVFVLTLDHWLNDFAVSMEWKRPGLLFSGSIFALVFALVVRFSAVAIGSVESSLKKIPPSLDMASRTLGCTANETLKQIHLPLIKRGVLIAGLLVFIESMKELNASLLLRPFNFETLATYVFNFASDEQLELAAMPAVLLVLVGLLPLIVVNRTLEHTH